jgi:hypothetical protein
MEYLSAFDALSAAVNVYNKELNAKAFIDGPIYKGVDIDEQDRLSKQLVIMVQLRDILAQRIEAFNK